MSGFEILIGVSYGRVYTSWKKSNRRHRSTNMQLEINRYLFLCSHTDSIACGQTRYQHDGKFLRWGSVFLCLHKNYYLLIWTSVIIHALWCSGFTLLYRGLISEHDITIKLWLGIYGCWLTKVKSCQLLLVFEKNKISK